MKKFLVRRLLLSILILFFVSFIIYTVERCLPASFVENKARQMSQKQGALPYEELLAQLNSTYGLDGNIVQGYGKWVSNAIRGNFGDSWTWNQPVTEKFKSVIWYSFALSGISFILQVVIAIPLGILSARKQYSRTDYGVTVFALIGISLPTFFIATLLKWVFSLNLGWFDLYGIVGRMYEQLSGVGKVLDMGHHLILPVITLTVVSIGNLMRYTRTNMLEVLNSDYIRTARAKGLPEGRVVNFHAFRNILIPIVTLLGSMLPTLFAGTLITETLFQIPGIGYTSYQSLIGGDIPFSMFYMVFYALLVLMGTLLADILYAVVDPRVRIN